MTASSLCSTALFLLHPILIHLELPLLLSLPQRTARQQASSISTYVLFACFTSKTPEVLHAIIDEMNKAPFNIDRAVKEVSPWIYSISVEQTCDWDMPDEFEIPDMDLSVHSNNCGHT